MSRRRYMGNVDFRMEPILYQYTGNYQAFIAPVAGLYKIECWGAQGCYAAKNYGGYVSGVIRLEEREVLYVYVGNGGKELLVNIFNGGGDATKSSQEWGPYGAGGAATDIRLVSGSWDNITSLRSRIMVAGAGAGGTNHGGNYWQNPGSYNIAGGGLKGYDGTYFYRDTSGYITYSVGGSQISGGLGSTVDTGADGLSGGFGHGGAPGVSTGLGSVGGSGYYGGGGGGTRANYIGTGAGGSSFISGHNGCNAINSSGVHTGNANHYSGKVFTETVMIDGAGYQWTTKKDSLLLMPNPLGGTYPSGQGHKGAGYCIISQAT